MKLITIATLAALAAAPAFADGPGTYLDDPYVAPPVQISDDCDERPVLDGFGNPTNAFWYGNLECRPGNSTGSGRRQAPEDEEVVEEDCDHEWGKPSFSAGWGRPGYGFGDRNHGHFGPPGRRS